MLSKTLEKIFSEIKNGTTTPKHPFKFGCLSSIENGIPHQRMVVIRKIVDNKITIYTDKRSQKVAQYASNPNASILFYDTAKMIQVVLKGTISIEEDKEQKVWKSISEFAHKDYTTLLAPGTPVKDKVPEYTAIKNHFCYLEFSFNHVDYLSIGKPNNKRAQYYLGNSHNWKGTYVVP